MNKRVPCVLLVLTMLFSLAACGSANKVQANSRYSGTVSAVNTKSITVAAENGEVTIELTENTVFSREFSVGGQQPGGVGQMPQGMGQMGGGTPPEQPGGQPSGAGNPQGTPPGKPEREAGSPPDQGNTPPEMPQDDMEANGGMGQMNPPAITVADISLGDSVIVETDAEGKAATVTVSGGDMSMQIPGGNMGMPGGMASGVEHYETVVEFTADASKIGESFASAGKDENAVHVLEGAAVSLEDVTISRNSADSTGGDTSSFYGVGAAALVTDGTLTIADSSVITDAAGGAGVFSYGNGTAYVMDTVINTNQDTSGGIHVAGGGTLYAWDLTVETNGESSAAIRSDRGSGTMVIDGGSYVSNGVGSPAIYSTADITAHQADLAATGSEAICIEGLNSIRLFDCNLSGDMEDLSQNDGTWNVILYQSMSGDSEIGNSIFEMVGGSLTAKNGGIFYTTNTESTFILSGVEIIAPEESEFFLKCTGNANQRGWGRSGDNGADCSFTARQQTMKGNVIWDSISRLDLYVLEASQLTGAVLNDESCAGNGYAALYIDESSTWVVTGNSRLTKLYCEGTILDADGNTVSIVGTDGTTYVQGTSQYTISVDSYENAVDVSGASKVDSWIEFSVAKP